MTYEEIRNKSGSTILITGDSLAYNRYGYDAEARPNAFDCGVGIPSWSFRLRDAIYKADKQFMYGADIAFSCESITGIDNDSSVPHTAMFGGRIQTLLPRGDVKFCVPIAGPQIVLYLQKRLDNPCMFDISVDGHVVKNNVDTHGQEDEFAGYGLLVLCLPCEADRKEHTVSFRNIRGEAPKITVAGVGATYTNVVLNGKGSQCVSFFIENFEERIGRHSPDLMLLSLGANDRGQIPPDKLRQDLIRLFSMMGERFPRCKILFLLPPSSHCPDDPERDVTPYTAVDTAEAYNRTIERVCQRMGKEEGYGAEYDFPFDIDTLRIADLFDNHAVSLWRFDNIHLNPHGNEQLLAAVAERIGIPCSDE